MSKGPWKSLEQRIAEALARKEKQAKRESDRIVRIREAYEAKIERTRQKQELERKQLQAQMRELELMAGYSRRLIYPGRPEREAIRQYRQRQAWSVRMMARLCRVASRQILALESESESVAISEGAMNRIR